MIDHIPPKRGVVMGEPCPDPSRRKIHVLRIKHGAPYRVLIVSWSSISILVHWDGRREVPHVEPADECACCRQGWKPRWSGWIGAWLEKEARYVLVNVTQHAVQSCPALDPTSSADLRGRYLTLRRIGESSRGPISASLSTERLALTVVPAELDVRAAVAIHYGLDPAVVRDGDDGEPQPD